MVISPITSQQVVTHGQQVPMMVATAMRLLLLMSFRLEHTYRREQPLTMQAQAPIIVMCIPMVISPISPVGEQLPTVPQDYSIRGFRLLVLD